MQTNNSQENEGGKDGSILDQIIKNQTAEEVANFNVIEIINNLFNELSDREKDVLIRRFGLHGQGKETLENIGDVHKLTRERIRQIETSSIKKLTQLKNLENYISGIKKIIYELLEEHGGFMEKDFLIKNLVKFSSGKTKDGDEDAHKSYLNFLISKLLSTEFDEIENHKLLKDLFKLKYQELDHVEELADELLKKLEAAKNIMKTEEIIKLVSELESYKKHEEKLIPKTNNIDISYALNNHDLFKENVEVVSSNKILYSIIKAIKKIEQNKFGFWGADSWKEIKPKTINDKIYLVLKNNGKPMHFFEIANNINEIVFDRKKANPATVHNELILDNKYVLVGKGLYALKEWGYEEGTVADVIIKILKENNEPLSRDEIINKVLEQRTVKKSTIILSLINREKFEKVDGKYKLKEA